MRALFEVIAAFIIIGLLIWGGMSLAAMIINILFALIFF
jgi:hypothetical protein